MTHSIQLVYLAFGAPIYQREAFFSIASALAHASRCKFTQPFKIRVFTDAPEVFAKLPVDTNPIDPAWAGPHNYHFRIKHAALKEALQTCEKAVLIDTDTFFRRSPGSLFDRVEGGTLLCNAISPPLTCDTPFPGAAKAPLVKANPLPANLRQTNSGVIGLVQSDQALLERSIALMDELRPIAPALYTLEELCLALAAHGNMELNACTDVIHHYWSRKSQFRAKIEAWLAKHHQAPLSEMAVHDTLKINDRLPRPSQPYRSWQKLLTNLAKPDRRQFFRELLYGCHTYTNEFDQACAAAWWGKALVNAKERNGASLPADELRAWLESPILKILAGKHYPAMHSHIIIVPKTSEPTPAHAHQDQTK
nr:hypothetical protein [uncultured Pseudomonas sp.]